MRSSFWLTAALNVLTAYAATTPSRTVKRQSSPFASVANGQFSVNGSEFRFVGTNAYWLPFLNSDEDISNTLANMSAAGITVVRTWAFNDVTSIPENGTWLQLIANGTTQVNEGPNGIQRLDKLIELAEQHNIYVLFSLTNNWNPTTTAATFTRRNDNATTTPLPRNFLSNDYGGMDAYVREFGVTKQHDEFYTNETIKDIFKNYTKQIVSRYANNSRVFSWELANDARCNSSIAASSSCNTNTVTSWHADVSKFVRSVDPNHLVSSGNHGFLCPDCPKLFPITPAARPSPAPGQRRSVVGVMTKARLLRDIADKRRKARAAVPAEKREGVKIRGRWAAVLWPAGETKRQSSVGTAFDGSQGVDSQDILNIPDIGFGSFQLFPDQNSYTLGTAGDDNSQGQITTQDTFNQTVQEGVNWIQQQAASAQAVGKPLALTGFGLVTQGNAQQFVPFNSSTPALGTAPSTRKPTLGVGITDTQRDSAYTAWLNAGIQAGVSGLLQYQWSSNGLATAPGTFVQGTTAGGTLGQSPNDGYATLGQDQNNEQGVLQTASQNIS
ncbi:glycoside hydrolase [Dentipellis sp. KUC8613]|nr:glycoside hydrolase [Dentipellis sp. KUC8613]